MSTADAAEVELGPCQIFFKPQGQAEKNLGYTIGGARFRYTPEFHQTKVDQVNGPVEAFLIREDVSAVVPLAQSVLSKIKYAFALGDVDGSNTNLTFGKNAGNRASSVVGQLRLHPVVNAADDQSDDVYIWKAYSGNEVEIGFTNEGEKIVEVTFMALADTDRPDGEMLGMIGDSGQA